MNVKKGDNVIVLAGQAKGKTGTVLKALPALNKVIVEGVNVKKKHIKARRDGQKGQTVEITLPIHVSNVKVSGEVKEAKVKKVATKKTTK